MHHLVRHVELFRLSITCATLPKALRPSARQRAAAGNKKSAAKRVFVVKFVFVSGCVR